MNGELGKYLEGNDHGLIKMLSRFLPGETENNHETHSEWMVFRPKFEQITFRMSQSLPLRESALYDDLIYGIELWGCSKRSNPKC
jgi:hypothetical protein